MIKCSKLVEVISKYLNFKELFAWGSNNHNKIKIYRVLLLWERFVGSAFFELTLAFYPKDLMGALMPQGLSESPNYSAFLKNLMTRHGLMLPWFKDLMNATKELQFIDPTFRHFCLVPSSGVSKRSLFICSLFSCTFFWRGVNRRQVISRHHHDLKERWRSWYARLPNKGAGGNAD